MRATYLGRSVDFDFTTQQWLGESPSDDEAASVLNMALVDVPVRVENVLRTDFPNEILALYEEWDGFIVIDKKRPNVPKDIII